MSDAQMSEFLSFVASVFGVPAEQLSPETAYGAIPEWDSVMQLRLVMEIEDRYRVDIPIETVPGLTTLGAFFRLVQARNMLPASPAEQLV